MITICLYMLHFDRLAIQLESSISVVKSLTEDSDFYVKQGAHFVRIADAQSDFHVKINWFCTYNATRLA